MFSMADSVALLRDDLDADRVKQGRPRLTRASHA
jgi:hypothetical protein